MKKIFTLASVVVSMFLIAAILPEPWNTVLFVVVIPFLHQLIKILADNYGIILGKLVNQSISLVLAFVFIYFSGGFGGLSLPTWNEDIAQFVSEWIELAVIGWGSLMVLYEVILDRLFKAAGFATSDKYE